MGLLTGQTVVQGDFVSTSSGSSDSGKVAKLDAGGKVPAGFLRFGGDGSDGALSISSGTTTINLASAQTVVKNYTSISITGTGKLAFSNPHANGTVIILRSQGNITLTSSTAPMVDASGMGAQGGAGGTQASGAGGGDTAGNNGSDGASEFSLYTTNHATGATAVPAPGVGGLFPPVIGAYVFSAQWQYLARYRNVVPGAGGGGGGCHKGAGTGSNTAGTGGRGGGVLIFECGGAWNFTTASGISVRGQNGTDGVTTQGSSAQTGAGGGGGGGGGFWLALWNILTANSGTVLSTGGTAGASPITGGSAARGGGGGASAANSGGDGGGTSAGNGGDGFSSGAANTNFS